MSTPKRLPPPPSGSRETAEAATAISFRGTLLAGALIILLTFGGFGTWAAVAPLSSAVVAEGFFKVSSTRKDIQHPEGGVVREILVDDGDRVEAGQVLMRLDDTQARATLDTLRVTYDESRARAARLEAEKSLSSTIRFPADLEARRDEQLEVDALLRNEEDLFRARHEALTGTTEIIGEKIDQLEQQVAGEHAQLEAKRREVAFAQDELDGLRSLYADGLVEKARVSALEREVARLEGQVGVHIAEKARLATQIAEEELNVVQVYRDRTEDVAEDLRETNTQLADIQARMRDAAYTLEHTVIRAPEAGIVMELNVHTEGGVIKPGETVLQLVPEDDPLIIEARIAPSDIEHLSLGQDVKIQLIGLKQRNTPIIAGNLTYLSADRITDEASERSYYLARIEVAPDALEALGDQRLLAGMPANVLLATGERTALEYLVQPILDNVERAWRED